MAKLRERLVKFVVCCVKTNKEKRKPCSSKGCLGINEDRIIFVVGPVEAANNLAPGNCGMHLNSLKQVLTNLAGLFENTRTTS